MNSKVYESILKKDVIQKTAIFGDVFNLNITNYMKKDIDEHTHRIELYSHGLLVGYIDATTSDISPDYPDTDMPFVLYTPIGKVTGHYSTHFELFKYEVAKRENEFEKMSGLFKVKSYENDKDNYYISSHMDIVTPDGTNNKIVFNNLAGNYQVELEQSGNEKSETARVYFNSRELCIDHFHYPEFNQREYYSKIRMPLDNDEDKYQIYYDFKDEEPFSEDLELLIDGYVPYWRKLSFIDYDEIGETLALFDERLNSFIDEVRNNLTLLANGLSPVSIYDKMAHLCFHNDRDTFYLNFSRAKDINTALDNKVYTKKED